VGSITNTSGERREPIGRISGRHSHEIPRAGSDGSPVLPPYFARIRWSLPVITRVIDSGRARTSAIIASTRKGTSPG
jgi:hypothetical protein